MSHAVREPDQAVLTAHGERRTRVRLHVDESVIPKLARLGEDVVPAFDAFTERIAHEGRLAVASRATLALDAKWQAYALTPDADVLTWWLTPELAYVWDVITADTTSDRAQRTQCVVDPLSGKIRIDEVPLLFSEEDGARVGSHPAVAPYANEVRTEDLRALGATDALIETLRTIRGPGELENLRVLMPQHETILLGYGLLARGASVAQAQRILGRLPERAFDPADHGSALLRSIAGGRIRVLAEEDDLAKALSQPWTHWMTYLHPEQRAIAYRPTYRGPAKVTGGPGTGKTIVAVHRVRCLLDQEGGLAMGEMPLLLTSFVTSTVHQLELLAHALLDRQQRQRVHIMGVDRLCVRLLRHYPSIQRRFSILRGPEMRERFAPVLRRHKLTISPDDAVSVWENVVLAADDPSWKGVRALRQGLGLAGLIDEGSYSELLAVCREVEAAMLGARETTHLLLLRELLALMPLDSPRYKHVVVDEAQDLHPLHWKLLRRLVPEHSNDLFLVGDGGQRLYRRPYALSQCGIRTNNRSKVLRLSYRSSQEILDFARALLGEHPVDDLDTGECTANRSHAVFSSAWPVCVAFSSTEQELAGVVSRLRSWRSEGMEWGEMMVAVPTNRLCNHVLAALDRDAIPGRVLSSGVAPNPAAVSIVTYFRAKGLEARAVLVIGATRVGISLRAVSGDHEESPSEADLRWRRALYVACTRARERLAVTWTGAPHDAVAQAIASGVRVERLEGDTRGATIMGKGSG